MLRRFTVIAHMLRGFTVVAHMLRGFTVVAHMLGNFAVVAHMLGNFAVVAHMLRSLSVIAHMLRSLSVIAHMFRDFVYISHSGELRRFSEVPHRLRRLVYVTYLWGFGVITVAFYETWRRIGDITNSIRRSIAPRLGSFIYVAHALRRFRVISRDRARFDWIKPHSFSSLRTYWVDNHDFIEMTCHATPPLSFNPSLRHSVPAADDVQP